MESPPRPDRVDLAAWASATGALLVATLVGNGLVRYGAWLVVFTIWMGWFVYYGVRWLYRPG